MKRKGREREKGQKKEDMRHDDSKAAELATLSGMCLTADLRHSRERLWTLVLGNFDT